MDQTSACERNNQRYAMYGQCGVKRKLSEVEEGMEGGTYIEQRQTLLDISMFKLRMLPVRRTEPSLRRSVLIYNTLRTIEHELQAEGVAPNPVKPNLFPPLPDDDVGEMTLEALPSAEHPPLLRSDCPPSPLPMAPDLVPRQSFCPPLSPQLLPPPQSSSPPQQTSSSSLSSSQSPSSEPPTLHHHPHLHLHLHSHPHHPTPMVEEPDPEPIIHTLQPVANAHKLPSPAAGALLGADRLAPFTGVLFDLDSRTASGVSPLPAGCAVSHHLATARGLHGPQFGGQQVDIFGDIDLTLYDFDLLSSFTSNVKMAPLSAEELMHSFPADSPPALSAPSPYYRNELLNDDLDHIMQVLVGI